MVLAGIVALPVSTLSAPLECRPGSKSACGPGGCMAGQPSSLFTRVDLARSIVERCDEKGCDAFQAGVARSGIYVTLSFGGGAAFVKIEEPTKAYIEVITLGLSTIVSHGACR